LSLLRGYGGVDTFSQLLTIQAENRNPALIDGAVVLEATAEGSSGNHSLEVKIQSPDENCDRRTSWWEVITLQGDLVARQVLNKVHQEQPFSSQIVSLPITAKQEFLIRAYFQGRYGFDQVSGELKGYADQALQGSIANGFKSVRLSPEFARWLESAQPQPGKCVE
jgi:hypothetical protein